MDPDAALTRMRDLSREILHEDTTEEVAAHLAADLAEQTLALDDWLRQEGFLPKDWAR